MLKFTSYFAMGKRDKMNRNLHLKTAIRTRRTKLKPVNVKSFYINKILSTISSIQTTCAIILQNLIQFPSLELSTRATEMAQG